MVEPSISELIAIRANVARIAKLSDGLVRFAGLRLGLDGILAWIPAWASSTAPAPEPTSSSRACARACRFRHWGFAPR